MECKELKSIVMSILPKEKRTCESFLLTVAANKNKVNIARTERMSLNGKYDRGKNAILIHKDYENDIYINTRIMSGIICSQLTGNEVDFDTKYKLLHYLVFETYNIIGSVSFDQYYDRLLKDVVITDEILEEVKRIYNSIISF